MRIWIELPDLPPELLRPAREDDDFTVQQQRRETLFRYFRASVDTKEEAERLAFSLPAAMLPAFKTCPTKLKKQPGRPRIISPKQYIAFLWQLAERFEQYKKRVSDHNEVPFTRVYSKFLATNLDQATRLKFAGKHHTPAIFRKLLTTGKDGYRNLLRSFLRPYRGSKKQFEVTLALPPTGLATALNSVVSGIIEGLRHLNLGKTEYHFNEHTLEMLLHLDPKSETDQTMIKRP